MRLSTPELQPNRRVDRCRLIGDRVRVHLELSQSAALRRTVYISAR
jgi:hypothetical protein